MGFCSAWAGWLLDRGHLHSSLRLAARGRMLSARATASRARRGG